jgi:flagellar assembly factor FliW
MLLKTKHFGEIEIDENKIIKFEDGLPGFDKLKKYTLLYNEENESPFKWLQSVDEPNLAFVVIDPFYIKSDYDIEISEEIMAKLGIEKPEDVDIYSIVVVPEDITKMSTNLKAPVIINTNKSKGAQIILEADTYKIRHYILEELKSAELRQKSE